MQIAILDFGTNTFNLLIADTENEKKLNIIYSGKQPVKLGKGGILEKIIKEDAFMRGMTAIENHLKTIKNYNVEKIYAFATSAIRDASNGKEFIKQVKDRFNIYVHIIPGEREAELIYKGVRQSMDLGNKPILILDIGGGSNEFIIADSKKIYWKQSFDLGMARMLEKFKPGDPISPEEVNRIEDYLNSELQPLFDAVQIYEPVCLIGASGSFETFSALLAHLFPERYISDGTPGREIYINDFSLLHRKLITSTIEERMKMPGMEAVRVEMIGLASIFVNFTLTMCKTEKIFQSDYSMKEGVIAEMLNI
jgi:exopolyphosphatase / guanosine-5'-triphosphate,3'-diphosphate pyrophosphatase